MIQQTSNRGLLFVCFTLISPTTHPLIIISPSTNIENPVTTVFVLYCYVFMTYEYLQCCLRKILKKKWQNSMCGKSTYNESSRILLTVTSRKYFLKRLTFTLKKRKMFSSLLLEPSWFTDLQRCGRGNSFPSTWGNIQKCSARIRTRWTGLQCPCACEVPAG